MSAGFVKESFIKTGKAFPDDDQSPVGRDDVPYIPDSAYFKDCDAAANIGPEVHAGSDMRAQNVHPRLSRFKSASDLAGLQIPKREWLVEDLVPMHTVTLLSGDGGTGKSLLTLQLAAAAATGGRWLGREVTRGKALVISAEDDEDELHRRFDSIARAEGLSLADLGDLKYRSLAGEDALLALMDRGKMLPSALYRELDYRIAAMRPVVLLLDTSADLFPGNEIDRAQVRHFIGLLRHLAIKYRCAVVLLSHPSVAGINTGSGISGSTAWNNSVRSRLYLERGKGDDAADSDKRVLTTMKANYGRVGGAISMTWKDGVFIVDGAPDASDQADRYAKACQVFLKLLEEFTSQGRQVNDGGGSNYAPKIFAEHPGAGGITKRGFAKAMQALFAQGVIRKVTKGPASRQRSHLERAV